MMERGRVVAYLLVQTVNGENKRWSCSNELDLDNQLFWYLWFDREAKWQCQFRT